MWAKKLEETLFSVHPIAQTGVITLLNFARLFIMMYNGQLKSYSRNSLDWLDSQDEDRLLAEEDAKESQLKMELTLDLI